MKEYVAPFALAVVLALSACAQQPETRPVVGDLQFSPREISPGETIEVTFNLTVQDPGAVKRVHLRGLPKNTLLAGTQAPFRRPQEPSTPYKSQIEVRAPAADGQYNLDLVIETARKTYSVPVGALAIRDTPSRILYTQFLPGSHTIGDCVPGAKTRLLKFEYTVADDNGASDFAVPTLFAKDAPSKSFIFFPHWEAIGWSDGKDGIVLDPPTTATATEQLVSNDIRIHCQMPQATLYEYVLKGQSVSDLTGKPTFVDSDPARYYVE